jgi:hypothetical protein
MVSTYSTVPAAGLRHECLTVQPARPLVPCSTTPMDPRVTAKPAALRADHPVASVHEVPSHQRQYTPTCGSGYHPGAAEPGLALKEGFVDGRPSSQARKLR